MHERAALVQIASDGNESGDGLRRVAAPVDEAAETVDGRGAVDDEFEDDDDVVRLCGR